MAKQRQNKAQGEARPEPVVPASDAPKPVENVDAQLVGYAVNNLEEATQKADEYLGEGSVKIQSNVPEVSPHSSLEIEEKSLKLQEKRDNAKRNNEEADWELFRDKVIFYLLIGVFVVVFLGSGLMLILSTDSELRSIAKDALKLSVTGLGSYFFGRQGLAAHPKKN